MRAAAIVLVVCLSAPAHAAPLSRTCFHEEATIVGTPGDDVLVVRKPHEVVVGLGGNDFISSTAASRGRLRACGGPGDDWIRGTDDVDAIAGGAGSDTVFGRGNADVVTGGDGDDLIVADSSGGKFDPARAGDDEIDGGDGDDRLFAFDGVDVIDAGGGDDYVRGGEDRDVLRPGGGDDFVRGGTGMDSVLYNDAPSAVSVDLKHRTVAGEGNDTVVSVELVSGTAFDDHMSGSDGDDSLLGGGGSDVLTALEGDDSLFPDLVASGTGGVMPHVGIAPGDDVVDGGDGTDLVMLYGWEPAALTIDLVAGTAHGHGADLLRSIEDVAAGAYEPVEIIGTDGPNFVFTYLGTADRVEARGGDDIVYVQYGTDEIDGGEGYDACFSAEVTRNCESGTTPKSLARLVPSGLLRLLSQQTPGPPAPAT